jgi:DcaP outer membrane protein
MIERQIKSFRHIGLKLTLSVLLATTVQAQSITSANLLVADSSKPETPDTNLLSDRPTSMDESVKTDKAPVTDLEAQHVIPDTIAMPKAAEPEGGQGGAKPAGSDATFEVYGFIMLDSGYNFGQINPDWFDVERPTQLPSYKDQYGPDGTVFFGVRQTRFGVKTSNPTPLGDLKTIFEFELFGVGVDAGQTTFRLRHAYGELGKFGAGQYWSPFMDIDVFPNSIEYWGPNGMVFFRNVQIRWMPIQGDSRVTVALERPGASADGGIYSDRIELQGIKPKFDLPDLSVEARLARGWGYVEGAAIFRKISWVDLNKTAARDLSGDDFGWGINLSSNLKFGKKDTGKFEVVYGHGIQNYMNDAPIDVGPKKNPGNPHTPVLGEALPLLGVVAFLDHTWSERFSSSMGYSMENIWNSDAETPSDFHQGHYALGNLLFYPVKNVMAGGEFQFGRRVNFSDGFSYNDYKVQFSFKYNFSKIFTY